MSFYEFGTSFLNDVILEPLKPWNPVIGIVITSFLIRMLYVEYEDADDRTKRFLFRLSLESPMLAAILLFELPAIMFIGYVEA